jgi:hypothetical protein
MNMTAVLSGMLILIVPAFLIVSGITFLAYRRRKLTRRD